MADFEDMTITARPEVDLVDVQHPKHGGSYQVGNEGWVYAGTQTPAHPELQAHLSCAMHEAKRAVPG